MARLQDPFLHQGQQRHDSTSARQSYNLARHNQLGSDQRSDQHLDQHLDQQQAWGQPAHHADCHDYHQDHTQPQAQIQAQKQTQGRLQTQLPSHIQLEPQLQAQDQEPTRNQPGQNSGWSSRPMLKVSDTARLTVLGDDGLPAAHQSLVGQGISHFQHHDQSPSVSEHMPEQVVPQQVMPEHGTTRSAALLGPHHQAEQQPGSLEVLPQHVTTSPTPLLDSQMSSQSQQAPVLQSK